MCGICGIHAREHGQAHKDLVRRMTATMVHRGPDDEGYFDDRDVALGMRRLSIIDLETGGQPIATEDDRLIVIFNGEIFNYRELRRELQTMGHRFRTNGDTEVIGHAYEQWGLEALRRLNGMFGLAIWDRVARKLVVARDPFGVKPIYFAIVGSSLVFASEVRTLLLHPDIVARADLAAIDMFLTLTFVPAPHTAFEGIYKVLPGHALVSDLSGTRLERYTELPRSPQGVDRGDVELAEELRTLIRAAVKRQMIADVPIGMMLSGGTDSAAVAAVMAMEGSAPVYAFTVGFDTDKGDEIAAARDTAERLGLRHETVSVSADEYWNFMPQGIQQLEEPVAVASTFAFSNVAALASRRVKVVLTGQGADEPFAGYARYLGERYGASYRRLPQAARAVVRSVVGLLPRNEQLRRGARALGVADPAVRFGEIYSIFDGDAKAQIYTDGNVARPIAPLVERWRQDVTNCDELNQLLYVDARLGLPDALLLYADKLSMAYGLEARVPFLDHDLMSFVEALPAKFKIRRGSRKYLLKRAVTPWVPWTIHRPKLGFVVPVDGWFRGELYARTRELLVGDSELTRRIFRPAAIDRMLSEHRAGQRDHKRALFSLVTLAMWHRVMIESPQHVPSRAW